MVIVPSLEDNQPQMALESMACGTPVVAFDTGGISEFVQDGITGRLASVGNAPQLARSIVAMIRDAESRKQMGHRSRMLLTRDFEVSRQTAKYRQLYSRYSRQSLRRAA
jgi:glycosyltransferase involved in cell wall biosynthesis